MGAELRSGPLWRSPTYLNALSAGHFWFSATSSHRSTSSNNGRGIPGHHNRIFLGLCPGESSRSFGIVPVNERGCQQPAVTHNSLCPLSFLDPHRSQKCLPPAGTVPLLSLSFPALILGSGEKRSALIDHLAGGFQPASAVESFQRGKAS